MVFTSLFLVFGTSIMRRTTDPYSVYQGKLRRLWEESPMKYEALRRAKIATNQYKCEKCGKIAIYRLIEVDHIAPVVRIKDQPGETSQVKLLHYVTRLNCAPDGLQVLDYECHGSKSRKENKERK